MAGLLTLLANAFPLWVLLGAVLALAWPAGFLWFTPYINPGLAVIMLGMGVTLTTDDFKRVLSMPGAVMLGVAAQFGIMPGLGWIIAKLMNLEPGYAAGLILVACCPGGTASNVVCYIARANVALSVLMTMCSTFAAIVLTPVLTKWLAGAYVPVDVMKLMLSTVQIVLAPLVIGLALNRYQPGLVRRILPVAPLISVITIALICASIIATSQKQLLQSGGALLIAVFLLHAFGFGLGYVFAQLFRRNEVDCRTISIEVGMQNSGLGAGLAKAHFSAAAAVPCAISATMHSIIGSILAGIWRLASPALHPAEPTEESRLQDDLPAQGT